MSKKISEMIPTGYIPDNGELTIAHQGKNYKITAVDFLTDGYPVTLLDTAGNSLGYLTGVAQSASPTDPVELLGQHGSFWVCGCDEDVGQLMWSFGDAGLNANFTVGAFFPFRYPLNTIDYFAHLDYISTTSRAEACTESPPATSAWVLGAGTKRGGVNRTQLTHGISDADSTLYYGAPNKKIYRVTSTSPPDGDKFTCGTPNPTDNDTLKVYLEEYTDFIICGTQWLANGGPWSGMNLAFYYGNAGVGDHTTVGTMLLGGSASYTWNWNRNTGAFTITGTNVNLNGTNPFPCPIGTTVNVGGSHTFTMTRNA